MDELKANGSFPTFAMISAVGRWRNGPGIGPTGIVKKYTARPAGS